MSMPGKPAPGWLAAVLIAAAAPAHAQEGPAFKFTSGVYSYAKGGGLPAATGLDLNLRYTSDLGNLWVGWFRAPRLDFTQTRAGWDRQFEVGPLRVQPSVQVASGGFVGGSLNVETGQTWFAGVGIGRTNLKPYVNLNFDPNDAWMLSGGYRWSDGRALSALLVGDNRENPDQRHLHLTWRAPVGDGNRITLDLLAKRGLVNGVMVRRVGFTAGYDWPRTFVRVAWDPRANFTPQDMLRLSAGLRF